MKEKLETFILACALAMIPCVFFVMGMSVSKDTIRLANEQYITKLLETDLNSYTGSVGDASYRINPY